VPKKQTTPKRNGELPVEQAIPAVAQSQAAAAVNAVPDADKADVAAAAMGAVPDAAKADVAAAAMQAVPDAAKIGVATAAMQAVPDAAKVGFATAAMQAVPDAAKLGMATAAMQAVPDTAKADVATAAVGALDAQAQGELFERLAPDQVVTNYIWRWIVKTFAFVLSAATVALVAAVFVSVDAAAVQMLLTVFTTTAGILAGFVSGRASTSRAR
jgi:hypothetical protein